MSFSSFELGYAYKVELKSKECIDYVLKPLKDHVIIKINDSLTREDIFRTVVNMAVNKTSVHSVSKHYKNVACETSLLYHLKKLDEKSLFNRKKNSPSRTNKNPHNR